MVGREAATRVGRQGSEHFSPPGSPIPRGVPGFCLWIPCVLPIKLSFALVGYLEILGNPETVSNIRAIAMV